MRRLAAKADLRSECLAGFASQEVSRRSGANHNRFGHCAARDAQGGAASCGLPRVCSLGLSKREFGAQLLRCDRGFLLLVEERLTRKLRPAIIAER
jgi:hypothetical protein